jgi:hypothetical protein
MIHDDYTTIKLQQNPTNRRPKNKTTPTFNKKNHFFLFKLKKSLKKSLKLMNKNNRELSYTEAFESLDLGANVDFLRRKRLLACSCEQLFSSLASRQKGL